MLWLVINLIYTVTHDVQCDVDIIFGFNIFIRINFWRLLMAGNACEFVECFL